MNTSIFKPNFNLRLPLMVGGLVLLLSVLFIPQVLAATDVGGDWVGGYEIDGEWTFVEAHFEQNGDSIVGSLDFRFDMTTMDFIAAFDQTSEGQTSFVVEKEETRLAFDGMLQADQFVGKVSVGETAGPFTLHRVHDLDIDTYKGYIGNYQADTREHPSDTILLNSAPEFRWFSYFDTAAQRDVRIYPLSATRFFSELSDEISISVDANGRGQALQWRTQAGQETIIPRSSLYREEEVRYPFGEITLAGTLLLPPTPGPHPAIVLMHGTSPQNRDYFRRWGHYFAGRGIAALVYDKPGAFDSAHPSVPSIWHNSVHDLANAAVAGVHYLQGRAEIQPDQVGIWTFSNSSWAGPLAAATTEDVAFIIATATSGVAQRQADVFQDDLNNISYYEYPAWAANSALAYLRFTREFSIFARDWDLPIPPPVRDYYGQDFDPLSAWANVTQPVLVINGQYDTVVDPVDAVARIAQTLQQNGHTDYTLVVHPDADHGLQRTQTGLRAEARGSRDRVLAPGVTELMTEWVLTRFDGQQITPQHARDVQSPVPVQISMHFEPGGRYALLPWYGRPLWQTFLLLLFLIVFGLAVIGLPVAAFVRRLRRLPSVANGARLRLALLWLVSVSALVLIAGLILAWVQIVHMQIGAFRGLSAWLHLLPVLGVATALLLMATLFLLWRAQQPAPRSLMAHAGRILFSMTALLFIWYIGYWHLLIG